jgi:hypothetical protein
MTGTKLRAFFLLVADGSNPLCRRFRGRAMKASMGDNGDAGNWDLVFFAADARDAFNHSLGLLWGSEKGRS